MIHPTPPDQKIREEALDTSGNFILEAPAGSGKTDLLIARYLALLSKVSHPRQILAVTYTRKAAIELEDRIVQKLNQAKEMKADVPENPWEALLLTLAKRALQKHKSHPAILFNPESLQVGTFHSFCASLVRGWPLESGIPPEVDLLEDIDQEALLEKAVDQYIRSILSEKVSDEERKAYTNRLASVNNYPDALSKQLKNLLKRRDRLKDFPLLSVERRSIESLNLELHRRLETYAGTLLSGLQNYFLQQETHWIQLKRALVTGQAPMGEKLPESIQGILLKDIGEWKKVAEVFLTGSGTLRKRFGPRYGFPDGFGMDPAVMLIKTLPFIEAKRLAFVAKWPDPQEDNVGLAALMDILILASGAITKLQELIRTQGMDYLELEMGALRALGQTDRPSEGLIFHHEHLRHILVDEAQDMNEIQVEILSRLTEGWEPGDGRTVFVVGDPKQSIYRFRRAEVSLFYEMKERGLPRNSEAQLPLKPLLLTSNFRSRPHLVTFANRLFEKVMSSPRKEYDEVEFASSEPTREEPDPFVPTTAAVFYNEDVSKKEDDSPLKREACWIAHEVAKLHKEKPAETIAILIPARTHLPIYVKELMELNVPLRLLEGEPLKQRPEVRHLMNLFIAMVRPYDDVAWAGAMRTPWFNVSNQILLSFKKGRGFWSRRILSGRDAFPELTRFCEVIIEANKIFGREPYRSTLSRLWEDLEGASQITELYGAAGVSNVRTFFDLLDLCSGMPGEEALLKLNRLLEMAYTPPDPKGAFSNVYMMTIHKAKGLEFDHVFAVNLDYDSLRGGRSEDPAYRMERLPGEEKHFLVAATADRRIGQQNLGSYLLRDLSNQRTLAEARRLFYVAATRAKESLTISGRRKPPGKGNDEISFKTPISSLLNIMKKDEDDFKLLRNPVSSKPVEVEEKLLAPHLEPSPFDAEPLPYQITSPSKIEDETSQAAIPGAEEEEEDYARAKGVVIHRILETLAQKRPCPDPKAIAVALSEEGIPLKEAEEIAPHVMGECIKAWETPDFRSLCESAKEIHSELNIEDFDGEWTLRVGRFDLLLKTEARWVVLDYKTGRPEKDVEAWLQIQKEHYRPQLNAYTQMVARTMNLPEEKVEWAILFTSLPCLVWQGEKGVQ